MADYPADFYAKLAVSGNHDKQPMVSVPRRNRKAPKTCDNCGTSTGPFKACSSCHLAFYCGKECQKLHWRKEHKQVCKTTPQKDPNLEVVDPKRGILKGTPESSSIPSRMATQPRDRSRSFEWDLNCWQHSKPAVFSNGRGLGCMQGETTACTIQALPLDGSPCTIRVMQLCQVTGIGVCTKSRGSMQVYWKYSSDGTKFCSSSSGVVSYGRRYGSGDCVTIRIREGGLEFDVNGACQGVAFSGFDSRLGPLYVRVHLMNSMSVKPTLPPDFRKWDQARLMAYLQNVGPPNASDPRCGRAEVELVS